MPADITPEPDLLAGEASLQRAIVTEMNRVLHAHGSRFVIVEGFGLDVAAWIASERGVSIKLLELKVFLGARPGGVGFGNQQGRGPQVDLLMNSEESLQMLEPSTRWILGNGTLPMDTARYACATSLFAKRAAMGLVDRGKQNNFRVADFMLQAVTWPTLCENLAQFLRS